MTTQHTALIVTLLMATPALAQQPPSVTRPTLVGGAATQHAGFTTAGNEGATWKLPGGPTVRAEPNTALRVLHSPQPLMLGPGAATQGYTVVLRSGRLFIDVPEKAKSAVVLAAPRGLTAIVKSGSTGVSAEPERTSIANLRGELSTSQGGGAYQALATDRVLRIGADGLVLSDMTPAPGWVRGERILVAASGPARLSRLSWQPVESAAGYQIDVVSAQGGLVASTQTTAARLGSSIPGLEPGSYLVRIASRDDAGLPSSRAFEAPVRVLGCELPEGAFVDERGTLRLGKQQKARFVGVEGLQMTYATDGTFVRASGQVGLFRGKPTTAYFRFPDSYELTQVQLAPRDLAAKVEIGPSAAVWPRDKLSIRIRAVSTAGEQVPAWLELAPTVLLGIDELDVKFTRNGPWLEASLPPQSGPGPWVVRVEVTDQFGNYLGRDFLEVAHAPTKQAKKPPSSEQRVTQR
ncbi:MAG: hypothetical protein KF718_27640 [Polyangiaceae bacterium]|nr:hypothetical protein [Polyangiaceae bacterium]